MNNILLSIIIPVYNVEKYLEQCIDTILNQLDVKQKLIEIILVDDGSLDNSGEICDDYSNLYSFIKVYHKKNEGLSATRNYGLKKSIGQYVWFIDSDDYIYINSLSQILKKIQNADFDILLGDAYIVDINGNLMKKIVHKGLKCNINYSGLEVIKEQIEKTNDYVTVVWLGIYKRKFLIKNKLYFKSGLVHEDELWTPLTLVQAKSVIYVDAIIYNYRIRTNSIMRSEKKDLANHIESFIYIFNNLPLYMEDIVKDKYVLSLLKDNISKRYLHDIVYWNFHKYPDLYKKVNRKQILKNSLTIKNKIRSIVLLFNINLYSKLSLLLKVGVSNEK